MGHVLFPSLGGPLCPHSRHSPGSWEAPSLPPPHSEAGRGRAHPPLSHLQLLLLHLICLVKVRQLLTQFFHLGKAETTRLSKPSLPPVRAQLPPRQVGRS